MGARCRVCSRVQRLPTFQVGVQHYALATLVGLGSAVGIGIAWRYLGAMIPLPFVPLLLAVGAGYLIGQAVSLSVNRKRGLGFQIIVGISTFLSYGFVSVLAPWLTFGQSLYGLVVLAIAIYLAIHPFR